MSNNIPNVSLIYNRYKKASQTRKASVEIRITHEGKQKYISTGIMLYPNQWKNGKITNIDNVVYTSQVLEEMLYKVKQVIMDMSKEGNMDIFSIPDRMKENKSSFASFCRKRAEIRKYGRTKDSQERYNRFLKVLLEWGKIKGFADITEENIMDFDLFLEGKHLKPYSKWNNYHRFLNSFIIDAMDAGHLRRNPYKWVHIHKDKSTSGIGKYLSPHEFEKIKNTPMPVPYLERIRDLFVFQTYTCLSYTDLKSFTHVNVSSINGITVYKGKRRKTGKPFTIPLLLPAKEILEKYNWCLPVISNVKYNEYLKAVASAAGITKPVSSHWARHTGATLLLNKGVDIGIVSKICGHSSIRITEQIYAKLLDETVVDAVKNMDDLL